MFKEIKAEEVITYLMLIVIGYYIAKIFSRSYNGFSVGIAKYPCRTFRKKKSVKCPKGWNMKKNDKFVHRENVNKECCNK
jgi:hypothetical protein